MRWAIFMARVLVGAPFLYFGAVKLGDPWKFAADIASYEIVGPGASAALGRFLPWIEVVCGAALILGAFTRGSAILVAGMNAVFAIAIISVLARGISVSCGCGLSGEVDASALHAAWNLAMLGACLAVALGERDALRLDRVLAARITCCPGLFGGGGRVLSPES